MGSSGIPPGNVPPPGGAPPAGGGGGPIDPNLLDILQKSNIALQKTIEDLTKSLDGMTKASEKQAGAVETTSRKIKKFGDDVRGIIMFTDDATDAIKGFSDKTRELAKNLLQEKGYQHTADSLTNMITLLKKMKERTEGNTAATRTSIQSMSKLVEMQKKLATTGEKAFDDNTEAAEEYATALNEVGKAMGRVAASTSKLKGVSEFTQNLTNVRRSLITANVMKEGRFEKYAKMGDASIELKRAGKARKEDQQNVAASRAKAQDAVLNIPGMRAKFEDAGLIKNGKIDFAKAAARKSEFAAAPGGDLEGTMAQLQEAGSKTSLRNKLLGGGIVENAAGSVLEMAGRAAPALAAIEAVKDLVVWLFDKNAAMNKMADQMTGAGGVFTGGGTGGENLQAIRANLTGLGPGELVSRYGLTQERNMKMAQAIIGTGVNLESLSEDTGLTRGTEFAPGMMGGVQQIAATTGRVAGMGDEQSINTTMKLLMQYRESMESTQSFFVNLNKDTRAAGISSIKYVSVIDDILGHFDRMNKTLDSVTGTMRILSRTGRATGDDLKAMMESLTGAGRAPLDLASGGYVAMQLKANGGEGMRNMLTATTATTDAEAAKMSSSLKKLGISAYSEKDVREMIRTPEGQAELRAALDERRNSPNQKGIDQAEYANAHGILQQGRQAAKAERYSNDYNSNKMSGVGYWAGMMSVQNPAVKQAMRSQGLQTILQNSGYTIQDMLQGKAISPELHQMLAGMIPGYQDSDVEDRAQILRNAGAARLDVAMGDETGGGVEKMRGELSGLKGDAADNLREMMKNTKNISDPKVFLATMRKFMQNKHMGGLLVDGIAADAETNRDLLNPMSDAAKAADKSAEASMKAAQEQKAGEIAKQTVDMATIFGNIFEKYFNEVTNIITKVYNILAASQLFGASHAEHEGAVAAREFAGDITKGQQAVDLRLKYLEGRLAIEGRGTPAGDKTQKEIADTLKKQAELNDENFGVGTGKTVQDALDRQEISRKEVLDANDAIRDAVGEVGAKLDDQGNATLTAEQFEQQKAVFQSAWDSGIAQVQRTGEGATATYHITINQNSASVNTLTGSGDDARRATEQAQEVSKTHTVPNSHTAKGPANLF